MPKIIVRTGVPEKLVSPSILYLFMMMLHISCSETRVEVSSVNITPSSLVLTVGDTHTLYAIVEPGNVTDLTVDWESSNKTVVSVSADGRITALSEGQAMVSASAGGKKGTCTVTVREQTIAVSSVALDKTEVTLKQNETVQLNATVVPKDATNKSLNWSTGNADIAIVSSSGLVKAIKEGTVVITVNAEEKNASCQVRVSNAATGENERTNDDKWDQ